MNARLARTATTVHQWVGLVVGVQILLWVLGGLVMTAIPIERVRGEHHVAKHAPLPLALADYVPLAEAARAVAPAAVRQATLRVSPRGVVWVLETGEGTRAVGATSGALLPPLARDEVARLAASAYVGAGRVIAVEYHPTPPAETGRDAPLWSADFDDAERTRFYLAPATGEVVTRRSALWRFYDFFWRLHIMNFEDGEDFNHPLVVGAAVAALAVVVSGALLLWNWLARRRPHAARVRP